MYTFFQVASATASRYVLSRSPGSVIRPNKTILILIQVGVLTHVGTVVGCVDSGRLPRSGRGYDSAAW